MSEPTCPGCNNTGEHNRWCPEAKPLRVTEMCGLAAWIGRLLRESRPDFAEVARLANQLRIMATAEATLEVFREGDTP